MGSRGRPFFDLNESPAEDDEENDDTFNFQAQKSLPSSSPCTSDLFAVQEGCQRMVNNHSSSNASPVSGFQPFVRSKDVHDSQGYTSQMADDSISNLAASSRAASYTGETEVKLLLTAGATDAHAIEREEGEWLSDMEGTSDLMKHDTCKKQHDGTMTDCAETSLKSGARERTDLVDSGRESENMPNAVGPTGSIKDEGMNDMKDVNSHLSLGSEQESFEQSHSNSKHSDGNSKEQKSLDGLEESSLVVKRKDVKGFEAMHALKLSNSPLKWQKLDQHKEAMLGKKRSRQIVVLNIDDVKQAGPIKTSTPRRQTLSSPVATRTVKEIRTIAPAPEWTEEKLGQHVDRDQKQVDKLIMERSAATDFANNKPESNGDASQGFEAQSLKLNNGSGSHEEVCPPPVPRQGLCKKSTGMRQPKDLQISARKRVSTNQTRESGDAKAGNKRHTPLRKQSANSTQCQDTSVERLLREVTSEKFWHRPGETDLQCVPGEFESVEEYVGVFEPLLFEECCAQLYSTWEELTETVLRDANIMVRIKTVERRERGWYDVMVLPVHVCKWGFKEGDIAILSTPQPGAARSMSNNPAAAEDDAEAEFAGRVAGTVRRYMPIDTRDPPGAILHFYVGDAYDLNSIGDNHVLKKFQPKSIWYLTVLGSLATTQREYIALHAFRCLNLQMQTAILKPSPEHFPKYEEQPPAMPECFTQNFVEHLLRTFNGPQLSAIQWAAMHTAAGTNSSGMTKRQDPWPFTLVQGPPGTGKTHTVWGMLNVIHLVQYQHYYTALLKKLAPESYRQANESSLDGVSSGSIDEVLQNMDQSLFRTLPKLCPKPRMLVCAPSNAATDELLARVLDRGFIDGEMKIYRPDVARVGVDSQSRAAQAVSVERRTEQLLVKGREEIISWMHQLRIREAQFSQQITSFQRELFAAAAAIRSQGSVNADPDVLVARDHNRDILLQNLAAVVEGRDKVLVEISRLLILESRFRPGCNFNLEEARAKLEASFANEAEIVFTTVSSSGRKLFSRLTHGFDMVVIDEAAQASEVAVLPPLSLGAARCVLVGDPQQLPATVISKAAGTLLYSRSLFERFQEAGCPTILLSVQYRMHPQIRDFPSRYFYQGRLTDSESVSNLADELYYKDPLLRPYIFYDVTHGRESHRGGSVSYQNIHEAQFSRWLYEHLQKTLKSLGGIRVSVGIITPYKLQLKCLQREFQEVLNSEEGKDLYINTVDAFQGQERDVIIMSCVRASSHGVGFVADIRRMNVALTRARRALWVVGNANALVQSEDWAALVADAKARNCFRDMDSIPRDLLVPKGPASYTPMPGKASSYMRGIRMNGPRYRTLDVIPESQFRRQSIEEEGPYFSAPPRNGSYGRVMKAHVENFEQSGLKRQHSAGMCKRDSRYEVQ